MKARLCIQQFELELSGGSARVFAAEGHGDQAVREAFGMVGAMLSGEPLSSGQKTGSAPPKLARRADVETSHAAAARASMFSGDHEERIGAAIEAAGARGACSKEIARRTGLTHIQVDRRLGAMGGRGLIVRRYERDADEVKRLVKREGCAVWVKA